MHTLIAFATQWGSKYGGINSFNMDFLSAFGIAYNSSAKIVCIVASATQEEIDAVRKNVKVHLVPLPYPPQDKLFSTDKTIWLGHDRITGAAANTAAKTAGGAVSSDSSHEL